MYARRDTKAMFAHMLEVMMQDIPLSQVRVAQLCARCKVERRVFYYHFRDKYDLVAWMFEQDYAVAASEYMPYSEELYAEAHRRIWEHRDFYRRAFEEDAQNSIGRYLLQFSIEANEAVLKRYLAVRTLPPDRAFEARHFAHGNVGCLVEWLRGTINATPEQLASWMFSCIPSVLSAAYAQQQA